MSKLAISRPLLTNNLPTVDGYFAVGQLARLLNLAADGKRTCD